MENFRVSVSVIHFSWENLRFSPEQLSTLHGGKGSHNHWTLIIWPGLVKWGIIDLALNDWLLIIHFLITIVLNDRKHRPPYHITSRDPKISSSLAHVEFSGYGGRWWCTYKLDAMRIQKTRHIEQVGDFSHVFYPLPTPKETSAAAAEQMFGIGGTYNILQSSIDIVYGTLHRWRWLWWDEHEMHFFLGKRKGKGAWEFEDLSMMMIVEEDYDKWE